MPKETLPSPEVCFQCGNPLVREEFINKIKQTRFVNKQPIVTVYTTVGMRCKECKHILTTNTFETTE